ISQWCDDLSSDPRLILIGNSAGGERVNELIRRDCSSRAKALLHQKMLENGDSRLFFLPRRHPMLIDELFGQRNGSLGNARILFVRGLGHRFGPSVLDRPFRDREHLAAENADELFWIL